jgi:hypothetical protein
MFDLILQVGKLLSKESSRTLHPAEIGECGEEGGIRSHLLVQWPRPPGRVPARLLLPWSRQTALPLREKLSRRERKELGAKVEWGSAGEMGPLSWAPVLLENCKFTGNHRL